jgi:hypothetical protein
MRPPRWFFRGHFLGRWWLTCAWVAGFALGLAGSFADLPPVAAAAYRQEFSPDFSGQSRWWPSLALVVEAHEIPLLEEVETDDEVTHSGSAAYLKGAGSPARWATHAGLRPSFGFPAKVPRYLLFKQLRTHLLA